MLVNYALQFFFPYDKVQLHIGIILLHIDFPRPRLRILFLQGYPVYSLPT